MYYVFDLLEIKLKKKKIYNTSLKGKGQVQTKMKKMEIP